LNSQLILVLVLSILVLIIEYQRIHVDS
jgi:hypothetical protein